MCFVWANGWEFRAIKCVFSSNEVVAVIGENHWFVLDVYSEKLVSEWCAINCACFYFGAFFKGGSRVRQGGGVGFYLLREY